MNSRTIALLCIIGTALLGGGTGAITKLGLQEIPPLTFAFIRFAGASLLITPFFLRYKGKRKTILKTATPISLFAVINIIFFTVGIKITTATISQILYAAVPLFVTALLFILFRERISRQKEIGILLGFLGVCLLVILPLVQKSTPSSGNIVGNLLIASAVISYSFYMVYSRKLLQSVSPFLITCVFIYLTTLVLTPFFLYDLISGFSWAYTVTPAAIASLIYVAVLGTIAPYVLNQYAIKHGGVIYASLLFYFQPLFGYLFAYALLGERLTVLLLISAFIILSGMSLVIRK